MRWWADVDQARTALARVDDSDVVQGVGTAVLGYHALAAGALRPLSEQTLVDAATIRRALSEVDLAPVSKALGAATRPVMGDAADKYGELLADNLHQQAVDSTARFVEILTNSGLDWPSAIGRAAEVHGVPLDRMGVAGAKLRGQRMPVIAQQDWADRALVGYAAHVGAREADGSVSKAMGMRTREFDEDDVNRDRQGRFAPKYESRVAPTAQEAKRDYEAYQKARAARRAKKAKRDARRSSPGAAFAGGSGAQVLAVRETKAKAEQEAEQAPSRARQRVSERMRERIKQRREERRKKAIEALLSAEKPTSPPSFGGSLKDPFPNENFTGLRTPINQEYYMFVPEHVAQEIVSSKGFNQGKLLNTRWPNAGEAMTAKETARFIDDMQDRAQYMRENGIFDEEPLGAQVLIRFVGAELAWEEGSSPQPSDDSEVANGATFDLIDNGTLDFDNDGFERDATDFKYRATAASSPVPFRSLSVVLANPSKFPSVDPGYIEQEDVDDTPPLPHDWIGKAERWDESEVNRDARGRFAREYNGRLVPVTSDKAERLQAYQQARKRRRDKRKARQARERVGVQFAGTAPLAAVAPARMAPEVAPEASSRIREQVRARMEERRRERIKARREKARADRRELRQNGYKGDPALDLSGLTAVFPDDEQVATLVHIGNTGGTYEESQAFPGKMDALLKYGRPGKDAVDLLDKDRPDEREYVAIPTYESKVPVFDTADEADSYAMMFASKAYSAWDGEDSVTPRIAEMIRTAERNNSHLYHKASPHNSIEGKWVPKVFISPPAENVATVIVGSDKDWKRAQKGEIPRFVTGEMVSLPLLMASNGFDAGRIENTHDAMVHVIRMDFMDNVEH